MLADLIAESLADRSREDQAVFFQHAQDLILEIIWSEASMLKRWPSEPPFLSGLKN
jgi:hypothetical protein